MLKSPTIFISTGEASGDLHGGKAAAALMRARPDCRVVGMGGRAMRAAGVQIVVDNADLGVVGLWEVLAHGRAVWRAYRAVTRWLRDQRPEVVVLVDYPEFHFRVARVARRLGLRVIYYITPQIWAWRSGRIQTMARLIDQAIVILPFERDWYRAAEIPCELVGHPLLDEVQTAPSRHDVRSAWGLAPFDLVVGLFPGSRRAEVRRNLPVMLEAAARLSARLPRAKFLLGVASTISEEELRPLLSRCALPLIVKHGQPTETLSAVDAAMVVSGTITLQAALQQVPMVILYKSSWLTYAVARCLVRVPFIGLPNLVAGECVAPEFVQSAATPTAIAGVLEPLLNEPSQLEMARKRLAVVRDRLGQPGGSAQAAAVIARWLDPAPTRSQAVS